MKRIQIDLVNGQSMLLAHSPEEFEEMVKESGETGPFVEVVEIYDRDKTRTRKLNLLAVISY